MAIRHDYRIEWFAEWYTTMFVRFIKSVCCLNVMAGKIAAMLWKMSYIINGVAIPDQGFRKKTSRRRFHWNQIKLIEVPTINMITFDALDYFIISK